jgi:signal transduction histidine kinase
LYLLGSETKKLTAAYLIALIMAFLLLSTGLILFVVFYHKRVIQHQAQIQKFHQEKHLELLQASIQSEEQERKRIAQELHDTVGATLATIRLYLRKAASAVADPSLLDMPAQLLDESISKVRMLSQQLQPDMLLYLGLVKALRSLAKRINGAGAIQVSVVQHIDWPEPPSPIVLPVYRVVQEIITNILRHGNATKLELHLKAEGDHYCISLEHNGITFTEADYQYNLTKEDSVGLKNIASRLEAANLGLQFPPANGNRKFIVVCLPATPSLISQKHFADV